jgi:hypothetical protein
MPDGKAVTDVKEQHVERCLKNNYNILLVKKQ